MNPIDFRDHGYLPLFPQDGLCFRLDVSLSNVICAITISQVTRNLRGRVGAVTTLNGSNSECEFGDSPGLLTHPLAVC